MPSVARQEGQSVVEATLSVNGLKCWAADVARHHSIVIRVLDTKREGGQGMAHNWVELLRNTRDEASLVTEIKKHKEVSKADVVKLKEGSMGLVKTKRCPAAMAMGGLNCIVKSHVVRPDGSSDLTVEAMGGATLKRFIERLQRTGVDVSVRKVIRVRKELTLTTAQTRALQLALVSGYFEYPRRIRQRELADLCGISSSTLAETLRRAERGVVEEYFGSRLQTEQSKS